MSEDLHLGGMAKRTHEGYLRAVRQLADFCRTSPDQISEDQVRRFFLHLKNDKAFASGSLRVAFSGIKFFYTRTCRRNWQTLAQMKIKEVKSLPEVLTIEQVHQIMNACTTQRMAVYFWTVYSLGLQMYRGWTFWLASGMAPPPERRQSHIRCKDCGGRLRVIIIVSATGRVLFERTLPDHALAYDDSE
jgi:site-specific recombinase XerD